MPASAIPVVLAALLVASAPPAPGKTASSPAKPAAAPAPSGAGAPAASEPRDWNEPPPGSTPEDAALWRRLRGAIEDATLAVSQLNKASLRLRYGTYYESLETLAKGSGRRAGDAAALRTRLESVARATDAVVPRPLRTQVCKYTLLYFEQRMDALDDPTMSAEMPKFRKEATGCADELGGLARRLPPKVTELEGVLAETDALLGRAAPAPGAAEQGGQPGSLLPAGKEPR